MTGRLLYEVRLGSQTRTQLSFFSG